MKGCSLSMIPSLLRFFYQGKCDYHSMILHDIVLASLSFCIGYSYSLTNRRLPDLRPVRRLDHFLLELNSSTTVPFLGEVSQMCHFHDFYCGSELFCCTLYQVHYDLTSPKYTDHEVCQLPDASYMLTSCIWSNTVGFVFLP